MDNVIVRTANKGDAKALADLLRQVGHVHAVGRPDIYHAGLTKYDEASAAAFYKRMGYRPQKTEYEKILNDGKNDQ